MSEEGRKNYISNSLVYKCEDCDYTSATERALENHIKLSHSDSEVDIFDIDSILGRNGNVQEVYNKKVDSNISLDGVKTDKESFDLTQIPFSSLVRLGKVFREGELKYGKDNWRKGLDNKEYQLERANHALKHLLIYIHELEYGEYLGEYHKGRSVTLKESEDDLAKVMWFCATQIELERLEVAKARVVDKGAK